MEHPPTIIIIFCIVIWFDLDSIFAASRSPCGSDIDAAVYNFEYQDDVLFFIGDQIWTLDTRTGTILEPFSIDTLFKGAPIDLDHANVFPAKFDNHTYFVNFFKNDVFYPFICKNSLSRCSLLRKEITDARELIRTATYGIDASFTYSRGMPQPPGRSSEVVLHLFGRGLRNEFDCIDPRHRNPQDTLYSICVMTDMNKDLYPNFYKLRPQGFESELVIAADAYFDTSRNETNFVLVGNNYINYTKGGETKFLRRSHVFRCYAFFNVIVTSIVIVVIVIILVLVADIIYLYVVRKEAEKSIRNVFSESVSVSTMSKIPAATK